MASQSGDGAEVRPSRVLIVDDEEPNRVLLSALLSVHGYRTLVAESGARALELLAQSDDIDLVLLDVMMPGMDGLDVCKRAREELGLRDLTIVFITALSDRESRLRARSAGANDFLVKPVDSYELSFRVENWLKLQRLKLLEEKNRQLASRLEESRRVSDQVARALDRLSQPPHPADLERATLSQELRSLAASLSNESEDS